MTAEAAPSLAQPDEHKDLPVSRVQPAYQQVATQLQELIMKGTLAVGERLPSEGEMAVQFGVSRSTVREALRGLSSQSLVQTRRGVNGGTFVAEPSAENVQTYLETTIGLLSGADVVSVDEILEARELFEVPAARLAARRRDDAQLQRLRATLSSGSEADLTQDFEGHKEFHVAVMEASGNRLLEVIARPVFSVLSTRFRRESASRDYWVAVVGDHRDIYEAIAAGDSEAAARLTRNHLERLRAMYERIDRVAPAVEDPPDAPDEPAVADT